MTDRTHPDSGRIITSGDILLHDAKTALMYEELRAAIDDGNESMTHADALAEIAAIRAENTMLRQHAAKQITDATLLTGISPRNGGMGIGLKGGACQLLAEAFFDQFVEAGAVNFLEVRLESSTRMPGKAMTVTMQLADGVTPGQKIAEANARIAELEAQLDAIGAGGVSGPLIGRAFDAADMATASAQGFRDGVASLAASAGSEPVALRLAAEVLDWMPTRDTQRALWDRHQKALVVVKAALVEAQQPAPSAAAPVGEAPLPLLVRDIAADLGTTPIQVCTALAQLGFGGHSVNMAVTPRMAKSLRAHFASPTPQADSQPAPDQRQQLDAYYSLLDAMGWESKRQHISPETWAADLLRDATAYRAARAPADSVTAPAYSIDADPQGIRARVAEAITGALAFGAQGANPPPTGHWLVPFWETAREEASRNRPVSSDTLYLLRRLLSNQHTLTGSEFREELTKIVGEATQAADSVLEEADPLQGAANWLAEAHGQFCVAVLQGCLMIGYNRAKRLHDAAIAARKQGANHD